MGRSSFFKPQGVSINPGSGKLSPHTNHYTKRLSEVKGIYIDGEAVDNLLKTRGDIVTYEVYEFVRRRDEGDLVFGTSIIYPDKVGREYSMTKGHSHAKADRSEIYYCLSGRGLMLMESPEGKIKAVKMRPEIIAYVPPFWKHRSVNTGKTKLVSLFVYPADAGHEYRELQKIGLGKVVLEIRGKPTLARNPGWGGLLRRSPLPR